MATRPHPLEPRPVPRSLGRAAGGLTLACAVQLVGVVLAHAAASFSRPLAPQRFVVHEHERLLARALGAHLLSRALDAVGWNAVVHRMRGYDGSRRTLDRLVAGTLSSENTHQLALLAGLVAALGLVVRRPRTASWVAGVALATNLTPILLQRDVRRRALRVPARSPSARGP